MLRLRFSVESKKAPGMASKAAPGLFLWSRCVGPGEACTGSTPRTQLQDVASKACPESTALPLRLGGTSTKALHWLLLPHESVAVTTIS